MLARGVQMAFYLNAGVTYILGLDLGNFMQPHFYETEQDKVVSCGLLRDYEAKILPFMTLAAKVFKENNREIFNCSSVTKLPYGIFPYNNRFLKKK